jgi:hypothetical protein
MCYFLPAYGRENTVLKRLFDELIANYSTNIIRASVAYYQRPSPPDLIAILVVMHLMNRMNDSKPGSPHNLTEAASFSVSHILQSSLYVALNSRLPRGPSGIENKVPPEWEDEPEKPLLPARGRAYHDRGPCACRQRNVADVQRLLHQLVLALFH